MAEQEQVWEWDWTGLNKEKLGRAGELLAQLRFISHSYDVYSPTVDDHGIDFIAIHPESRNHYYIQVKTVRNGNYTFVRKDSVKNDENFWIYYIYVHPDNNEIWEYMIPLSAWDGEKEKKKEEKILFDRDYENGDLKSKPEWGISGAKSKQKLFKTYWAKNFFIERKDSHE